SNLASSSMPAWPSARRTSRLPSCARSCASPVRATPMRRATPRMAKRPPPDIRNKDMSFSPRVIALIGFGEAGSAIARGLCLDGGWRGSHDEGGPKPGDNAPRRVIAIDTALDKDARGTTLGKAAPGLNVAIEGRFSSALGDTDLV